MFSSTTYLRTNPLTEPAFQEPFARTSRSLTGPSRNSPAKFYATGFSGVSQSEYPFLQAEYAQFRSAHIIGCGHRGS